ncbi:MAG TPA: GNAT family N-acetyltransferase [Gemmatimonadales bacterium]|nr:GNAT family N-acetyltransferase [Gemmatimonadales bacterium]
MPQTLTIRRATAADAADVAALGARTFHDTFAADNRPDDMAAHLATMFGVPQQTAELIDGNYVTLLAYVGTALAAFAQVRRREPPPCVEGPEPVELHRFYVDMPWHGQGVAARLMAACAEAIREFGGRTVWLSVWEHNPRARAFYAKCGFRQTGTADFFVGSDRQTDHILERALE